MNLDRNIYQGEINVARHRIKFVLDELEKLTVEETILFGEHLGKRLTLEEVIGALVAAEQQLQEKI